MRKALLCVFLFFWSATHQQVKQIRPSKTQVAFVFDVKIVEIDRNFILRPYTMDVTQNAFNALDPTDPVIREAHPHPRWDTSRGVPTISELNVRYDRPDPRANPPPGGFFF